MQADTLPTAPLPSASAVAPMPEADQVAVQIVLCDEAGRPRSGRLLRVSACLAALPLSIRTAA